MGGSDLDKARAELQHLQLNQPAAATALFDCADADGTALGAQGAVHGSVSGSFIHLIDRLA